jgi:hypothetical protein
VRGLGFSGFGRFGVDDQMDRIKFKVVDVASLRRTAIGCVSFLPQVDCGTFLDTPKYILEEKTFFLCQRVRYDVR